MKSDWGLVIILWGGIIVALCAGLFHEFKKTPEQRETERRKFRENWKKDVEEVKGKLQETEQDAPPKGCLLIMLEFGLVSIIFMIILIGCILLLASVD